MQDKEDPTVMKWLPGLPVFEDRPNMKSSRYWTAGSWPFSALLGNNRSKSTGVEVPLSGHVT
ncbi:hypothetical protein [Paenibacillus sp. FSL E2-0201]|uniref:hypothetical protein n=1 Tax=Paenibacillus sp. FSL E2-0201 TaxID=2954726 RepID=UPI0030D982CA